MIYTDMTMRALKLAYQAHDGQVDKSGVPYVFHPFHLAEQMKTEETVVVALLHDVVEDTDYSLEDIRAMGFPDDVMDALALLTHDPSVPYMDYVRKIKINSVATAVKLADLTHNSDTTRMWEIGKKDLERLEKYRKAIRILSES